MCSSDLRPYPDIVIVDDANVFGKALGHVEEWVGLSMDTITTALGADTIQDSGIVHDWGVFWRSDRR